MKATLLSRRPTVFSSLSVNQQWAGRVAPTGPLPLRFPDLCERQIRVSLFDGDDPLGAHLRAVPGRFLEAWRDLDEAAALDVVTVVVELVDVTGHDRTAAVPRAALLSAVDTD